MTELLTALGFVMAICAGWVVVLLCVCGLVLCSNKVSHMVLRSYGGWKTFLEYREWYAKNKAERKFECLSVGELKEIFESMPCKDDLSKDYNWLVFARKLEKALMEKNT